MSTTSNDSEPAKVCHLPSHSGDGYGYGGGAILCIGSFAIPIGEGRDAEKVARELARLWNDALAFRPEPSATAQIDASAKIEDGGPAFPSVLYKQEPTENWASDGMSKRDWFAGQALPTIIALIGIPEDGPDDLWNSAMAAQAYAIADAMLAAPSPARSA